MTKIIYNEEIFQEKIITELLNNKTNLEKLSTDFRNLHIPIGFEYTNEVEQYKFQTNEIKNEMQKLENNIISSTNKLNKMKNDIITTIDKIEELIIEKKL